MAAVHGLYLKRLYFISSVIAYCISPNATYYDYGVRGIVLDWFVSYLANRSQHVKIDDTSSALLNVSCGVPQGSILGPLLFIIYTNDITNASNIAMFILFADDTNLFVKHHDLNTLFKNINLNWVKLHFGLKLTNYRLI